MDEVRAAMRMLKKNRTDTTVPAQPIWLKMYGRVSNTRPGPSSGWMPAAKTAGITAKPASRANSRSKAAVQLPAETIFSSFRI